jgi:hypothetical protein
MSNSIPPELGPAEHARRTALWRELDQVLAPVDIRERSLVLWLASILDADHAPILTEMLRRAIAAAYDNGWTERGEASAK